MTLKKYTLKVKKSEYWQEIHDTLCGISSCEHIPDRQVSCTDEKEHSPTRGTFSLHGNEVEELKKHPYIDWIELCPVCNPDAYPKPQFATRRFKKNVKVYRDLGTGSNIPPTTNPSAVELDRTNWGVVRTGIKKFTDFFSDIINDVDFENGDVSYSLTGKNVDIIIHDSGVLQYHPEFLDANGQSRVRDIILDGPFYIDPNYFISNGYTTTRADGRVTGSEVQSRAWWTNSANRSPQFQSEGTVFVSTSYTEARSMGASLDGTNSLTSGHGTSCASLAAGKNFGVAFEANIWNMPGIADNVGMSPEPNYDAMKIWHRNKPINPATGVKNPTIINGSWGYQAAFSSSSTVSYRFRGETGTFTGNAAVTDQVTAMKQGLSNQVFGAYRSWSSSSRSNSTDTAGAELMESGVIYVAAAGNNNQRLGIGSSDPDRLNYLSDNYFGVGDSRFGGNLTPCNHRDWMNPQGIGFDSSKDFHPVICVGAMEDSVVNGIEYKASYSNNGPGIDCWSPADETLAAGTNGVSGYTDYQRYDDSRFYDNNFNGTSAAAPVATGVIALYLQLNPKATSKDVKNWLKDRGSILLQYTNSTSLGSGEYLDQYPDDTTTLYWTQFFNLRGAETRIIHNLYANDEKPSVEGVSIQGIDFIQS
jgi:hypothetical protein